MPSTAFQAAYALYVGKFPDLASLGVNAATWQAEYDRISPGAFDQVEVNSQSLEGGNWSGKSNFPAITRLNALCARRAELDDTYTNPFTVQAPQEHPYQVSGSLLSFNTPCSA